MTDYYLDSRATGANDGDPGADTGPDSDGIYQDAWQTIDAAEAGMPTNGAHTLHFVAGSGPYYLTGAVDGIGNDKTIEGNWCIVDGSIDLNSDAYQWTQSAANPAEYYAEAAAGGDPSITTVTCGTIAGRFQEGSAEESEYQMGTPGTLADGFMGYGDNDSLGYNTVYVRVDAGHPSTVEIKVAQVDNVWDTNFVNNTVNDLIMQYASVSAVKYRASSGTQTHNRCVYKFAASGTGGNGIDVAGANNVVINNGLTFFCGHRAFACTTASAGDLTVNGCIDVNSHLFGYVHASYSGTLTLVNNIGYGEPAGVIDLNNNASFTFVESNNCWFPSFAGGGALEYPDGADNDWTTTAATDFPPSADTGIGTRAALLAAGGVDPLFVNVNLLNFDACDFSLKPESPLIAAGIPWWTQTGPRPNGVGGEPFPDFGVSLGRIQSVAAPMHPRRI